MSKPLWATFDSFEQADADAKQLEGLLAQGIVPTALLERTTPSRAVWTLECDAHGEGESRFHAGTR